MTAWRATFRAYAADEATPLGLTITKPGQGVAGTATFPAGEYPACSRHGALNRVARAQLWRCPTCNIGVELLLLPCCCGGNQDRGCEGCPTSPALRRLTDERRKGAPQ